MANRILIAFTSFFVMATIFLAMMPVGHLMGHDYYHAVPRLLLGAVHFWQNGLAIPNYTPNLCGGIPVFADPQSYYYSLPQFLSFFVNPWIASRITIYLFYGLAYLGCVLLFQKRLRLTVEVSHLGALLFVTNGFVFANLYVGHLTHHSYLLLPFLFYFLLNDFSWRNTVLFSLIWIYTIYAGGFHILPLFLGTLLVLFPFFFEKRKTLVRTGGGSLVLVLVACGGKMWSSFLYARNFHVRSIHFSDEPLYTQLLRYFWFDPYRTPYSVQFGDLTMGAWEYVGFVSRLVPFAILYFLLADVRQKAKYRLRAYAVIGMSIAVFLLATASAGNVYLPFFRHYHNPIKLFAILIPLFVLIFVLALHSLTKQEWYVRLPRRTHLLLFILFNVIVVSEFSMNSFFFLAKRVGVSFPYVPQIYDRLKVKHQLPTVTRAIPEPGKDMVGINLGFTTLSCYEPNFGYQREAYLTTVEPGPVNAIRGDAYNLNHPGCLLYPEAYACKPWDRIPTSQTEEFTRFVEGKPAFPIPWSHRVTHILGLLFTVGLLAFGSISSLRLLK